MNNKPNSKTNKSSSAKKPSIAKKEAAVKEALAFLETRGKTGIIGALDIMPKTSDVKLVNRVNIGSGMLTVIYEGEVAAAESARDAARILADDIGEYVASNVIPRPDERIYSLVTSKPGEIKDSSSCKSKALGIVEADGFVAMVAAADSGIKSADVIIPSWLTVGSGLTTVFFRGEVAAVHSAVESGALAASKVSKVVAVHVIPQPHAGTEETTPIGGFVGKSIFEPAPWDSALGIIETRGITGLIEGIDAGLKAANVVVQGWEKIGKGMTSTIFRGSVADVRTAVEAAVNEASKADKVEGSYIIARPHKELDSGR